MPATPQARVELPSPGKLPLLTTGICTPEVIQQWHMHVLAFQDVKSIADDRIVRHALAGFEDPALQTWVHAERSRLVALSIDDFIAELRMHVLPLDWIDNLHAELMTLDQGARPFLDWVTRVKNINATLPADRRLSDAQMLEHLRIRLSPVLRALERKEPPQLTPTRAVQVAAQTHTATLENQIQALIAALNNAQITNFAPPAPQPLNAPAIPADTVIHARRLREWIEGVQKLEEGNLRMTEVVKQQAEANARQERARRQEKQQGRNEGLSKHAYSQSNPPKSRETKPKTPFVRLPKLTDAERTLLSTHNGCWKCRRFYQNHGTSTCPNDFPSAKDYKTLTEEMAKAAKPKQSKSKVKAPKTEATNTTIEEVSEEESSGTEGIDSYAPFHCTSAYPPCLVSSRYGEEAIPVTALVDSGATAVTISPECAKRLGLTLRELKRPEELFLAKEGAGVEKVYLTHWVRARIWSRDKSWRSASVKAKVFPGLSDDMILGMPFLIKNRLVHDFAAATLIDKRSGYDLLHQKPVEDEKTLPATSKESNKHRRQSMKLPLSVPWREPLKYNVPTPKNGARTGLAPQTSTICAIKMRIAVLAHQESLDNMDIEAKKKFARRFPEVLPHISELPNNVYHRIKLKDVNKVIQGRTYSTPKKYREAWRKLIGEHVEAGRIRRSDSEYASPAFLIPKADPTAAPRWVNDYRELNANTVRDRTPLPRVDEILNDCARGKIFGKIDMTNSFFQTRMHPEDVKYTAVNTPFGLYEWLVMPMGACNSPATHQRRMYAALHDLIGKICHVYLDDIIIWSETVEEHDRNIAKVMEALEKAGLYCSLKKTKLYCTEVMFLGHVISERGIEADPAKVARVIEWPIPRCTKDVRAFLGLVRYIANFLPRLAEFTSVLTPLTQKELNKKFPPWTNEHQKAFDGIKELVTSRECLTTIDHDTEENIFVSCDASDRRTGAVLSVGPTWQEARPVAFESAQYIPAEKNYPVHEKELLAIVRALKKWRIHLLGCKFKILTDHRTLVHFMKQKDLSRRQARWMEFLSQYDFDIEYVKGEDNTSADAMSRYPEVERGNMMKVARMMSRCPEEEKGKVAAVWTIAPDPEILEEIRGGYEADEYCQKLKGNLESIEGAKEEDGLLYVGNRLVIPRSGPMRESLYRLAHDDLGHFGTDKTYAVLRESYYWPNMRKDLETSYLPGCAQCQRNKSSTKKPAGPLHPLPVPDKRFDSVAIDFIGPLPEDGGFNGIVTMTDRLGGADIRIEPIRMDMTAEQFAVKFFDSWYCENGLPLEIISDRDKLFVSRFWKALHDLTGIKVKMSTSFHPETDGASERTNKTVNQLIRYHIDRNQQGWVRALPRVRFCIMNTVNASTGFTPFQLRSGYSPRLVPPLVPEERNGEGAESLRAMELMAQLQNDVAEAKDALLASKTRQAHQANRHRNREDVFKVGNKVMLSTSNRRREYKAQGEERVAKFMPRFDGPYFVIAAFPEKSEYMLELPNSNQSFPGFHASQLRRWIPNDDEQFPGRALEQPEAVDEEEGVYEVDSLIDRRRIGRGIQYLVKWRGYGDQGLEWKSRTELLQSAPDLVREYNQRAPRLPPSTARARRR